MKVDSKILASTLENVLPLCKNRTTLPILTCVKLLAKEGTLTLTATDLDAFAAAKCECEGNLDPVCLDGLSLHHLARIAQGSLGIWFEGKKIVIEGAGTAHLGYQEAEEFPPWPKDNKEVNGLSATDLGTSIEGVAWAADPPNKFGIDPWKESVWVKTEPKYIECAATNGKEFAYVKLPAPASTGQFLFAAKQASRLCSALNRQGASISVSDSWISVTSDEMDLAVKLSEGKYVNVRWLLDCEKQPLGSLDIPKILQSFETIQAMNLGEPWIASSMAFENDSVTIKAASKTGWFTRSIKNETHFSAKHRINLDAVKAIKVLGQVSADAKAFLSPGAIFFQDGDYTFSLALMKEDK